MNNAIRQILVLLFTALISTISAQNEDDSRGYIVEIGQLAPDFTLTTIEGDTFRLSEKRGKVLMLQFTASWCGVCRKEMPHIEKEIWQIHKDKDFELIGIDRDEPYEIVKAFSEKMGVTYPMAADPKADVFALYARRDSGVTRNVIINRDGKIVFLTRLFREKEFNEMKKVIEELLDLRGN